MLKILYATLTFIFLYSCSDKQNSQSNNKPLFKYYDFNLNVDIVDPFTALESRILILNAGEEFYDELLDTLYFVQNPKSDALYFITYNNSTENLPSDKFQNSNGDTTLVQLTKPEIDTIYNLTSKVFHLEPDDVFKDSIPPPPIGDAKIARVVINLKFMGDNYSRLVKKTGDKDFQLLYNYLLTKKNSR